jgi:hypothetical protein
MSSKFACNVSAISAAYSAAVEAAEEKSVGTNIVFIKHVFC